MNVVEIINEAIASGRTRFAFELLPPLKGDGMQKIFAAVEPLMALDPAYVNITFHREGIKETWTSWACTTCWRCAETSRRTKSVSCPIRRATPTPWTSCGRSPT